MAQRLTYRKRHSYATKSNHTEGKLLYQSTNKRASGPKCPVTGKRIQGIPPHLRPAESTGGDYPGIAGLSGSAVRERAKKLWKKVLKIQKAKEKQSSKS